MKRIIIGYVLSPKKLYVIYKSMVNRKAFYELYSDDLRCFSSHDLSEVVYEMHCQMNKEVDL